MLRISALKPEGLRPTVHPMLQNAPHPTAVRWTRALCVALLAGLACGVGLAQSANVLSPELLNHVQALAQSGARAGAPAQARVEVQLGQLDPRLRLAPCSQVQPYLPAGQRMWGRSRIGLRCADGSARWNVTLPVLVQVYTKALVATQPLPAGVELTQEHLRLAEIDMTADAGSIFTQFAALDGRALQRPLAAGEAVRSTDLRQRRWFAAGERVQVLAAGAGYAIASEGQALEAGFEGKDVRVRFENGRTVTGRAVGDRRVEVLL